MKNNLSKIIEEQSDIIAAQSKTINQLSQLLLRYISAEELDNVLKLNKT